MNLSQRSYSLNVSQLSVAYLPFPYAILKAVVMPLTSSGLTVVSLLFTNGTKSFGTSPWSSNWRMPILVRAMKHFSHFIFPKKLRWRRFKYPQTWAFLKMSRFACNYCRFDSWVMCSISESNLTRSTLPCFWWNLSDLLRMIFGKWVRLSVYDSVKMTSSARLKVFSINGCAC